MRGAEHDGFAQPGVHDERFFFVRFVVALFRPGLARVGPIRCEPADEDR
ncbi:hypothetical protein ACFVY4_02735 [Streptomyces sp. NPDC058299]